MNPLLPKQPRFFELFQKDAACITEIARLLKKFSETFSRFGEFSEKAKGIEHHGDVLCHEIIDLLNKSFITPFDREDIYQLAHELDDIVDLIEDVIHNIELYGVDEGNKSFCEFAEVIVEAAVSLETLIAYLPKQKNGPAFTELVVRIHELEDKGDAIFQNAISTLFSQAQDTLFVIKWKDIFENLEEVMDTFQKVSDTIEGIMVKSR